VLPLPSALLAAIGAATGLVGSLLGIGGGVFLVPLLTLALGVPIRAAIAASLISVIASATATTTVNMERGLVNLRLGLVLEVATTIGGLGGGIVAALLSQKQLFLVFGVTLAAMGVIVASRSGRRNVIADPAAEPGLLGGRLSEDGKSYVYHFKRLPLGLSASLVAGAISGLLGVGGGIIKVPVLTAFCGIPIRIAAGTSAYMIGVTAAASVFIYYSRGDVMPQLAAAIALGALPASLLGARLSRHLETRHLKLMMAVILLAVGARMALEAL
jgi:uncharacterized membrane protein YfcA